MKHYPPHEYKVHRRVAGGGFVCNPNFTVRRATDHDDEVTCRACLSFMHEQDRKENMTKNLTTDTPNVLAAVDASLAQKDGRIAELESAKRALEASLATEKFAHSKTKSDLLQAKAETVRYQTTAQPPWMTATEVVARQNGVDVNIMREFFAGVSRGLEERRYLQPSFNRPDAARLGYELVRRFT